MSYDYEFSLNLAPTSNHYHQPVKMGNSVRCVVGAKAKSYQAYVIDKMIELGLDNEVITSFVHIDLELHRADKRKFDISNFLKGYEDGLVKSGFLDDDHLIQSYSIRKFNSSDLGNVMVVKVRLIK